MNNRWNDLDFSFFSLWVPIKVSYKMQDDLYPGTWESLRGQTQQTLWKAGELQL